MDDDRLDLPQGTLDLLILRTLAPGPLHGWAISERIQQVSRDVLQVPQGSLYPALHRLERRGWIRPQWGVSDNNRKAKSLPAHPKRGKAAGGGNAKLAETHRGCRPHPRHGVTPAMLSDLRYRLRALFRRSRVERELDDELRFHLERQRDKYHRERNAEHVTRHVAFALISARPTRWAKEECRDARGIHAFEEIIRNVRYARRTLARRPGFATVVVLTLGLRLSARTVPLPPACRRSAILAVS